MSMITAREYQVREHWEMRVLGAGLVTLLPPFFVSSFKLTGLFDGDGDDRFCDVVRQVVVVVGNLTTATTTTATSIGFGCFGADKRIPYDHDQIDVLDHSGGFLTAKRIANTGRILGIVMFLLLHWVPIVLQARPLRPLCLAIPVVFMVLSMMTLRINPLLLQSSFCQEFVELRYNWNKDAWNGPGYYGQGHVLTFSAAGVAVHDKNDTVAVHCELGPRAANTDMAALGYLIVATIIGIVMVAIFRKQDSYRAVRTTEAPQEYRDDDGDAKGLEMKETHDSCSSAEHQVI
jgi:hypothetical protein